MQNKLPEPKPLFIERMKKLLGKESDEYFESLKIPPIRSIRCNTLKISPADLKQRLENKGWKIKQPWKSFPEAMIIESALDPGELGRALEHVLGYYYIQELASMLPVIALDPKPYEIVVDLASAPGSKTTQIAAAIENTGTILANEISLGRIKILASNLERCGVSNTIITKKEGSSFCNRLSKKGIKVDRILIDAPCSGEGTIRDKPKTLIMWNPNTIRSLSGVQKQLINSAMKILKKGGTIVYSTCTHAPEENEEIIDYALATFPDLEIETIKLTLKAEPGITEWEGKKYNPKVKLGCRIYPHKTNTEGFFLAKFKRK